MTCQQLCLFCSAVHSASLLDVAFAGAITSPIKFDDDDAGNDFVVVDGSTALIKDYESATDQCPSLESMQITFKSPGSFKRERADSVSRTPRDSAGAAAAGVPEGGEPDVPAGTDASPASERVRRVERSPFPGQHGSFSPSVFFQSPMPQHGVQMVDGFVVPSPSMSKSAQKKRSVAASKGKSSSASARKRAAVPGGYVNADNAAGAGGSAGGRCRSASLSPPATRGRSRATTPDSPWDTGASAGLSEPRGHLASAESGEKPVFTHRCSALGILVVHALGEVRVTMTGARRRGADRPRVHGYGRVAACERGQVSSLLHAGPCLPVQF